MPGQATTIIRGRPKAGPITGAALALAFAVLMTGIATADEFLIWEADIELGQPAPFTIRVPHFSGLRDDETGVTIGGGSVVVRRGDLVDQDAALAVSTLRRTLPDRWTTWIAYAGGFFLLALLYTSYLRRSPRGKLFRTQAVNFALLIAGCAAVQLLLVLTPMSVLIVPVGAVGILAALAVDMFAGLATALVVAFAVGLVAPFDAGVLGVLAAQGVGSVLMLHGRRKRDIAFAGLLGGGAAGLTYVVFYFLSHQDAPVHELARPLQSAWLAAAAGGFLSAACAIPALSAYQWLLGEISRNRLVELADLSNPLLKQIAQNSPGTWQHSLAMANMAEIAANAIGANGQLVRVGAYYHDLGKSLQPKYFIENQTSGETSPHDSLPPEVSCDAIFAHVTEGVRVGRKEGLPERVIDFMHMHHGDGLLEYFWSKCLEQGNPNGLTADDFRYPGVRPQTRETAILAICDAVEAASRTLKQPDARAIENLVQRIVYGKLHLGQLDDSGLSMADLRKLSNSLIETIKHAHHVRVEYPWQREERDRKEREERNAAESNETIAASPRAVAARDGAPRQSTQNIGYVPPLDSLDVPRPYWRERAQSLAASSRAQTAPEEIGNAATERVSAEDMQRPESSPPEEVTQPGHIQPDEEPVVAAAPEQQPAATPQEPAAVPVSRPDAVTMAPPIMEQAALSAAKRAAAAEQDADDTDVTLPAVRAQHAADDVDEDASTTEATPVPEHAPADDPHERPTRPVAIAAAASAPAALQTTLPGMGARPARSNGAVAAEQSGSDSAPILLEHQKPDADEDPTLADADERATTTPVEPLPDAPSARTRPPKPPPRRAPPSTIELMKRGGGDDVLGLDAPVRAETHRAQSEDGALEPGMMVVGPPPTTRVRRGRRDAEHDEE